MGKQTCSHPSSDGTSPVVPPAEREGQQQAAPVTRSEKYHGHPGVICSLAATQPEDVLRSSQTTEVAVREHFTSPVLAQHTSIDDAPEQSAEQASLTPQPFRQEQRSSSKPLRARGGCSLDDDDDLHSSFKRFSARDMAPQFIETQQNLIDVAQHLASTDVRLAALRTKNTYMREKLRLVQADNCHIMKEQE